MKKRKFYITTVDGEPYEVEGWVEGEWGVWKDSLQNDRKKEAIYYNITHIPTGLRVSSFYNLRPAQNFIKRAAQASFKYRWNDPDEAKQNLPKLREIYKAVLEDYPQYTRLSWDSHLMP